MKTINTLINFWRSFWADAQLRKTVMWIIGTLGLAILVYGAYTYYDANHTINDLDHKADVLRSQYPTVEVDGEEKIDLRDAPQTDLMLLAMYRRDSQKAEVTRNRGVMFVGIGIIGLALAYLVAPEEKSGPQSGENSLPDSTIDLEEKG